MTTYRSASIGEIVDDATLTTEIEAARKHLAAAIEAKGEGYVYIEDSEVKNPNNNCLYLNYEQVDSEEGVYIYTGPKSPSCIVGHVLVGMGVPFEKITEREGDNAKTAIEALGAFTSNIVIEALHNAQERQDSPRGHTWGEAVEAFEDYIEAYTIRSADD